MKTTNLAKKRILRKFAKGLSKIQRDCKMVSIKSDEFGKDSPKAGENSNYMAKGLN